MTEEFYYLGYLSKVHGVNGGLLCQLEVSIPSEYKNLESVFIEIDKTLVPFFIANIQIDERGKSVIHFEEVKDTNQAREFVGKKIWRPINALPPLKGNHFYYHEIQGYLLMDIAQGDIGIIREVMEMPAQDLIAAEDEQGREYLIPLTEGCVVSLNRQKKQLTVVTPDGLIALYRGERVDKDE